MAKSSGMQWCRRLLVVALVVAHVFAEEEYKPQNPGTDTGSVAQFDVLEPPKETSQQTGGRDESKDPSKWIMNLVSTKVPPSKRYRRPTTVPPKAIAQGSTETYDEEHMGISVSPE